MDYNDFSDINETETLYNFLEEKKLTHLKYCHYSGIKGIDSILKNQLFWLSEVNSVNDKRETCGGNDFFLCLSATDSENIPMWYLYGGIDGQGARISFKKSVIKKWLNEAEQSIYLLKYNIGSTEILEKTQLISGSDILSLKCSDVLYISCYDEDSSCRIKYNNHTNYKFTKDKYNEICSKFTGFCKSLPWFYEKEFRIAVKISDSIAQRIHDNSSCRLAIAFSDEILSELEVMTGPELIDSIDFNEQQGFSKFVKMKIRKSRLSGELNMKLKDRLCHNCRIHNI